MKSTSEEDSVGPMEADSESEPSKPYGSGEQLPGAEALLGQTLADRYRITELIGTGGMGAVYRADHVLMHKTVAIKILHRQMTVLEEAVKRFEREAIAAGRIQHPNVAVATDFGRLGDGSFYLVLEHVAGRSLRTVIDESGPVAVERSLLLARQIAAALEAAHAQNIVHRDLKPDNIMLVERGAAGELVKVLDFGIAKVSVGGDKATELTQLGTVFGTPQYMAPEQAAGNPVDGRADLYTLGLIWHELLRGMRVYEGGDLLVLLTKQMTEPPPPLPANVPGAVAQLVLSLLHKDPNARPQSATEVIARIDELLGFSRPAMGSGMQVPAESASAARAARMPTLLDTEERSASSTRRDTWNALLDALDDMRRTARPWLRDASELANHRVRNVVPVWVLGAGAIILLLGIGLTVSAEEDAVPAARAPTRAEPPTTPTTPTQQRKPITSTKSPAIARTAATDPELLKVIALAKQGSQPAIFALEQRDQAMRTADEWMALAHGQLRRRKVPDALLAFERAIAMNRAFATNKAMLGGLRYYAERDGTSKAVLDFAGRHLGEHGADLIFHVWASTSRQTNATRQAWILLNTPHVQQHMSEALGLTLALRAAQTCADIKKLLPRIEAVGDERCRLRLRSLMETDGCGSSGKDDCYPCLRQDSQLKDALTQVQMRNAPRFEMPRRWR